MTAALIFPHQLFEQHPALQPGRLVVLLEDELFFRQYPFHKTKLWLHRASMRSYADGLQARGYTVRYESSAPDGTLRDVIRDLAAEGYTELFYADPADYLLERRLRRFANSAGIRLHGLASPGYLCTAEYIQQWFENRRYFLTDFYVAQRKRFDILIDAGKPRGGKWTYDTENRSRLPKNVAIPKVQCWPDDAWRREAAEYVNNNFPDNPGLLQASPFPINHQEARALLQQFLQVRLASFGTYQDAIALNDSWLFHSWLAPALNMGLLTPDEVVHETLSIAEQSPVPLNALEGFIRQVLGWREFVRAVYVREGVRQRTTNHWQHTRPIPASWWTGTTGIVPIDTVIKRVLETGYCNHIERLMVLGNFMLLCRFDPDDVYRWFMTLFADAYDWVMVPNVYGMCQYADGGMMTTKPYISGSNYILKMSHFEKGPWCDVWDALYWQFIGDHRAEFIANPRMSMMVRQWDKMDPVRKQSLQRLSADFLAKMQ